MTDHVPDPHAYLPELNTFVSELVKGIQSGRLADWETFTQAVKSWFIPKRMAEFEHAVPGWGDMAACADGVTLVHMGSVFTCLILLPEFQQATPNLQRMAWWTVLFHDIAKRINSETRDYTHGFRSAAAVGLALADLGFKEHPQYTSLVKDWASFTSSAVTHRPGLPYEIQDNTRLPKIMDGIDQLFGEDSPAALITTAILLHMSVNVVSAWPQAAPLSAAEERAYLSPKLLPLLKIMMLTDNDAWSLFEPDVRAQMRLETLAVFDRLETE